MTRRSGGELSGPLIQNDVSDPPRRRCGRTAGWTERQAIWSRMDRRVDGWTDPARTDRAAAALTEMNESPKRRVRGNIRSGAAGVPDTLLPLAAASPR